MLGTAPKISGSVLGPSLQHMDVLEHRKVMKLGKSLKPRSYERLRKLGKGLSLKERRLRRHLLTPQLPDRTL